MKQCPQFELRAILPAGAVILLLLAGCAPPVARLTGGDSASTQKPTEKSGAATGSTDATFASSFGSTMGTRYEVKIANPPAGLSSDWKLEIDLELRRVNDQMSTYLKSSEISRFNVAPADQWFEVSKETVQVVATAIDISAKTGGAFDITIGPLVDLWSFGPAERTKSLPSDADIEQANARVDYQKIEVQMDPPALRKTDARIQIDLSSIAKGHGVDRVIAKLKTLGCENAFVNIGGEIAAIGDKGPEGSWTAGVERPDDQMQSLLFPVSLREEAIATSGDYRNFFVVDGKRYSHTIDPRTGRPVTHGVALVSVVSSSCMLADAWATALNVLGPKEGTQIAKDNDLDAFLLERVEKSYEPHAVGRFVEWYAREIENASNQ